jgi:3-hydroxyacyl-CoA dehydrogenase/enoyl-CoA hydratase/3-hydroxybutyryl-CoA epimerase
MSDEMPPGGEKPKGDQIHLFGLDPVRGSREREEPPEREAGGNGRTRPDPVDRDAPATPRAPELRAPMAGVRVEELSPGIASIVFEPPEGRLNILTSATLYRLHDLIGTLRSSPELRAVVVRSAAPRSFIAGADVNEIGDIADARAGEEGARLGQAIFTELSELNVPVVAAINGICLGGGAELALACHYRVASDADAVKIGLPEVRLGILPGFGGTQRLPRLVGLPRGLDLILSSRTLDARRAKRAGLVDLVIPEAIFEREVKRFVELLAAGGAPARGVPPFDGARKAQARRAKITSRDRFLESRIGLPILRRVTRRSVEAKTKGHYRAPLVAMDVMFDGWGKPLRDGLAIEARALGELIVGEEKQALVHVFFLNEAAKRDRGVRDDGIEPRHIDRAGLLGAGVMGGGIAQLLSQKDIPVRLKDLNDEAILSGLRAASKVYRESVRRRRMKPREMERRLALIQPTLDHSGFGHVDIVFEAVVESMSVKKAVLAEAERIVPEHCIFASNTSALSITELAAESQRPSRVAGFHFFNPVHRMPLVEVIRGDTTSDETIVTLMALARRLGKTPIVCRDGPGFLVNRILGRYMNEAGQLLAEGVSVERCDHVAVEFGMPMGPIRLIDEVGVDVASKVAGILLDGLGTRYQANNLLERLAGDGRLGRKSGRGFYVYTPPSRWALPGMRRKGPVVVDPSIDRYVETGGRRFSGSDREIRDRLIFVMIDEAARCLDERIVQRAGDVDVGMIFGTGFPPFRGGLLYFADQIGAKSVVETLTRFAETVAPRFAPSDRLKEMAAHDRTFY